MIKRSAAADSFPSTTLALRTHVPARRSGSLFFSTLDGSVAHAPMRKATTRQAINGLRNDVVLESCISPTSCEGM